MQFPKVPKGQKRVLFHTDMPMAQQVQAEQCGWTVTSVLSMPNETLAEKRDCVLAWLEGIRVGTIEVPTARLKSIELEAKCLGMLSAKKQADNDWSDWDKSIEEAFGG